MRPLLPDGIERKFPGADLRARPSTNGVLWHLEASHRVRGFGYCYGIDTGAARLMLALLEPCVTELRGMYTLGRDRFNGQR
jgi:hypothetical protein